MKKIIMAIILFSTTSLCLADNGFRNVLWGTAPEAMKNLTAKIPGSIVDEFIYSKENDDMKVGDAKAESILYHFWKNRFFKVSITTNEPLKLMKSCTSKWGSPKEMTKYRMRWLPNDGDNEIILRINPIEPKAILTIQSDSIDREISKTKASTEGF